MSLLLNITTKKDRYVINGTEERKNSRTMDSMNTPSGPRSSCRVVWQPHRKRKELTEANSLIEDQWLMSGSRVPPISSVQHFYIVTLVKDVIDFFCFKMYSRE